MRHLFVVSNLAVYLCEHLNGYGFIYDLIILVSCFLPYFLADFTSNSLFATVDPRWAIQLRFFTCVVNITEINLLIYIGLEANHRG